MIRVYQSCAHQATFDNMVVRQLLTGQFSDDFPPREHHDPITEVGEVLIIRRSDNNCNSGQRGLLYELKNLNS
jgi:hypothetical protein